MLDIDPTPLTSLLLKQRKTTALFTWMVASSLLLHLVLSIFVMLPGRNPGTIADPIFVELSQMPVVQSPQPPAAATEETPLPAAPEMTSATATETAPEMAKLQKAIESSLGQAAETPEKVHESSIGLGMTAGYFGSFAEGETLKDEIREYYFSLMRRINEVWWMNGGKSSRFGRSASINIVITREGKIAAVNFLESSGDADYDRLLLESLKKAEPLPPLPRSYMQRLFSAPIRFIPPLNLMMPKFLQKAAPPHGMK